MQETAAVKLVTKSSQRCKIDTTGEKKKGSRGGLNLRIRRNPRTRRRGLRGRRSGNDRSGPVDCRSLQKFN
ncbi:hypothetical protein EVAR_75907_1 [Eumeta japonica]|uniref:Uncharacterized protein n=1 Tax=Eumeta variegata TaxID=151549 RepID=A0A4C1UXF5_EUMVA|nr:hypothetical protein EVAR_75907_1 [Eumeta japonica]